MTAMPVVERMTAEEFLARPYDRRERGAEPIDGVIVIDDPLLEHELEFGLAPDALLGE